MTKSGNEIVQGPWRVQRNQEYSDDCWPNGQAHYAVFAGNRSVASWVRSSEEAALISAAPDMYAALKAMISPDAEGDIDQAMAAIRKAEGTQS